MVMTTRANKDWPVVFLPRLSSALPCAISEPFPYQEPEKFYQKQITYLTATGAIHD